MAKKRDRGLGERCRYRIRWIQEADLLLAEAKEAQARAEVVQRLRAFWLQAGGLFTRAARLYRQAGLGLSARECYRKDSPVNGTSATVFRLTDCP
jgi:predicted CoA-binding protein